MSYGFLIIFLAWLWQWYKFGQGHRSMDPWFLRLFALGMLVLVLDTFRISNWLTWANVATLVITIFFIWKFRR